ncbi:MULTISPECIES: hypothetical protein [Microvirga]|uniref:hypothetical protein n=1 Tax=Microvirga TaxID=186650 RepID=UPI0021C59419|nr:MULTISPECIES: hypothetical protein [unclassified Microvirga]
MHRLSAAIGLMVILASGGSAAWAQQQFDGRWNIEAVPSKGGCARVYRYTAVIENGAVRSGAPRRATIRGRLDPSGRIQGTAESNRAKIEVTGSLSGRSGSGHWSLQGRRECSGHWRAEKQ